MAAANMDAAFVEAVNSVLTPLETKMNSVESAMLAADKREDYDSAAELSEELNRLKMDFKQTKQNTLKRLLRESRDWLNHESEAQKQALQEDFERHERERAAEFAKQRAELKQRHDAEEQELKDQIYGLMTKSMKYSKQVLEMFAVVKSLATQKRYREAAEYKKLTDAAADKERARANSDLVNRANGGPEMSRLLERHRIEKGAFEGRVSAEERSHTDDLQNDLDKLRTQFRVADNILRDRYNFNCRAVSKGLDMLNCLPSLPIAASHKVPNTGKDRGSWSGTPVSNLSRGKSRASSRGGSRRSNSRPNTPLKAGLNSNFNRIDEPAAATGKLQQPGWGLQPTGMACDWCASPTASIEFYIPAGDNRKCGHFCNWACAKAWNQCRSPAQFRFVRDLRIDTLAKDEVTPAPVKWGKLTSHQLTNAPPANQNEQVAAIEADAAAVEADEVLSPSQPLEEEAVEDVMSPMSEQQIVDEVQ